MKDTIIKHKGQTVNASTVIAELKLNIEKETRLTDAFAIKITKANIDDARASLAAAGIDENTVIESAPKSTGYKATRGRFMGGYSHTAEINNAGDINNMMRRGGNPASY